MKNLLLIILLFNYKDYFVNHAECQLNKIRNDVTDSKLMLFSNVLDMKGIPNYLKLFSDRAITREISTFRMSAHYLCPPVRVGRHCFCLGRLSVHPSVCLSQNRVRSVT